MNSLLVSIVIVMAALGVGMVGVAVIRRLKQIVEAPKDVT